MPHAEATRQKTTRARMPGRDSPPPGGGRNLKVSQVAHDDGVVGCLSSLHAVCAWSRRRSGGGGLGWVEVWSVFESRSRSPNSQGITHHTVRYAAGESVYRSGEDLQWFKLDNGRAWCSSKSVARNPGTLKGHSSSILSTSQQLPRCEFRSVEIMFHSF